jgi:hypothetical protein
MTAGGIPLGRPPPPADRLERGRYRLEVEDCFDAPELRQSLWLPNYLPHWSTREESRARFRLADGTLRLLIEADQPPWCPEHDGWLRVSSVQTGQFSGPAGSSIGQHRFREHMTVRESLDERRLYTPTYGLFEGRLRALDDPADMVALWMIGYEDKPTRSGEILIAEIFGRDIAPHAAAVGMGIRAHGDPALTDGFSRETLDIDVREFHDYAVEWTSDQVAFYVDERLVKVERQSPAYPMQFMLGIYEFADGPAPASSPDQYPKVFEVDRFRGSRRST